MTWYYEIKERKSLKKEGVVKNAKYFIILGNMSINDFDWIW